MRRVHTPELRTGTIALDPAQSHHVRDVLRLGEGELLELFDDAGRTAVARVVGAETAQVLLSVNEIAEPASAAGANLTVASALPKGERADWMIEKLSELGVARFIPLQTARSVVHPEGKNKFERWTRLATESAKQSRRIGVMRIEGLTPLASVIAAAERESPVYLSPLPGAPTLIDLLRSGEPAALTLLIGPEGGWTDEEIAAFAAASIRPARLTHSILRIETAAVAAAAIALCASNRDASP